jgi:hypothetical protein
VSLPKPRWSSAAFLVYTGGLTVLFAAVGSLSYLSDHYRSDAFVLWSLLVFGVLSAVAHGFRRRGRWVTAGIFAFATVISFGVLVGAFWSWFGWLGSTESPFRGFDLGRLSLVLLTLVAAGRHLRRFRFPMIALIRLVLVWFFVTDLVSGGGSWSAVVTLVVGLVYLAIGGGSERPTAFWYHVVSGALVAGSLLYWWHANDWNWALVAVAALVYVRIAALTGRSSWAVLGAAGLLAAAVHYTNDWTDFSLSSEGPEQPRAWVPFLVFGVTGFFIVALGLIVARRRGAAVE